MDTADHRTQVKDFISSRRARITPDQAGLPAYGGNRRVQGLRREEVALLAGVSIDYYIRMEREHLFALARSAAAEGQYSEPTLPRTRARDAAASGAGAGRTTV